MLTMGDVISPLLTAAGIPRLTISPISGDQEWNHRRLASPC
tara:strand:- start:175 stop:297 length:123 start_codon:yes stop_codon:yes gene_type:complete